MSLQAALDQLTGHGRLQGDTSTVMTLDIERLPGQAVVNVYGGLTVTGDFWDLSGWKHVIGRRIRPDEVTEWPRTICVAWRWYGSPVTEFVSEWTHGRRGMLQAAWDAYDRATVIYGHNIDAFDSKHLNSEWRDMGLPAPSPYRVLDTLREARRSFGDESKTLAALTERCGIATKTDKYSVAMARAAVNGDSEKQAQIQAYNVGDIDASEAFVDRLRGWIPGHPHTLTGGDSEVAACNQCWGTNLEATGQWRLADVFKYPLYRCGDCGGNVQGRRGVRVAVTRGAR